MSVKYGKDITWRVESVETEPTGAVTLEVVFPWDPAPIQQGQTLALPALPALPVVPGFRSNGARWKRSRDGGMGIAVQLQGLSGQSGGGGGNPGAAGIGARALGPVRWSGQGSLQQLDIRTNRNFPQLKEKYGWDEDEQAFPEKMPEGKRAVRPWEARAAGVDEDSSPLYGVVSWDDFGAVITATWIQPDLAGIFDNVGRIINSPFPALGRIGRRRNWRILPPNFEPHGDLWRISQGCLLSLEGGWNEDLYGEAVDK